MSRLWDIGGVFAAASLLSFGGGTAIVPELQREAVGQHGWLTARQFADSFAIAQAAPGPSTLLVTLLGFRAAGLAGALAATLAMVLPATALAWLVARSWQRTGGTRWHRALEHGLAPVGVGLVAASGAVISSDFGTGQWLVTGGAFLALVVLKARPLLVLAIGGITEWLMSTLPGLA